MTNKKNNTNLTKSEEDYLKVLFSIGLDNKTNKVKSNQLAEHMNISPASVNNMIKKLSSKSLVNNERYGKLELTEEGTQIALSLVRKHRLWETFLSKYLNFSWDEVHEIAEQLEHVQSNKLIDELDRFMDYPEKDPHGTVIPTKNGVYKPLQKTSLAEIQKGKSCKLVSVKDSSAAFLKYVSQLGLALNSEIKIIDIIDFDESILIQYDGKENAISKKFAEHVFVQLL